MVKNKIEIFQNKSVGEKRVKIISLLLCSDSRNDVPPVPQRNVSIAAERGAVRPST